MSRILSTVTRTKNKPKSQIVSNEKKFGKNAKRDLNRIKKELKKELKSKNKTEKNPNIKGK